MRLRETLMIAGLCVFSAWHAAGNAADYDLSRGRGLLLNKWGLQIKSSVTYAQYANVDAGLWSTSNFTGLDFGNWPSSWQLGKWPAGTQWGRWYPMNWPEMEVLRSGEMPFVNSLVSLQYSDELNDYWTEPRLGAMASQYNKWRNLYPNVLAHTNFGVYGLGGTPATVNTYMQATHPDLLMFDYYTEWEGDTVWNPTRGGGPRKGWYETMQEYRTLATAGYGTGPIPLGQYTRNFKLFSHSAPSPDESYIRLYSNASWAFGFTYLDAFVYNDATDYAVKAIMFNSEGDFDPDTTVFGYVAEANRQSRNLGPALVRLVSTDIRMIGDTEHDSQPANVADWAPGAGGNPYITAITPWNTATNQPKTSHGDVLIGYFEPLLASNPGYTFVEASNFMIVNGVTGNTAAALAQTYRINFNFAGSDYDSLVRLDRSTGEVVPVWLIYDGGTSYRYYLTLEGGTGDLFGFWDSSTPLPTIPEPGVLTLLSTGLIGALAWAWRKHG